jgi:hypothetical protein
VSEKVSRGSTATTSTAPHVRFASHSQSGGFPVLQVWRTDDQGSGAWTWIRTPADFCSLTGTEWEEIKEMAVQG